MLDELHLLFLQASGGSHLTKCMPFLLSVGQG
jgi:hypothetical protein